MKPKYPNQQKAPHELNYLLKAGRLPNLFLFQAPTLFFPTRQINAHNKNQNLKLFIRGYTTSGAPIIKRTIQLPKAPINISITTKKS